MKMIVALLIVSGAAFAGPAKILPVNKAEVAAKKEAAKKIKDLKVAPCDEKAKKPVEIIPEAISLSGNTGCSLDEAN